MVNFEALHINLMQPKSTLSIFICSSFFFWSLLLTVGCRKESPREFPDTYLPSEELCSNGILDNSEIEIDCGGPYCAPCQAPCTHSANTYTLTSSLPEEYLTIINVVCSGNTVTATASQGHTITFTFGEVPEMGNFYNTSANAELNESVDIFMDAPVGPNYVPLYFEYQNVYVTSINGSMAIVVCDLVLEQESNSYQKVIDGTILCN